jgi:hypothetical protein
MLGFNLAFIGDVRDYHSPQDNYENVDLGSLQHHGENMLGIVRAVLADDSLANLLQNLSRTDAADEFVRQNEAVYFDMLAMGVIWWPMNWTLPLVGVIAIICLLAIRRVDWQTGPQNKTRPPGWTRRMGLLWLSFLASGAAVWAIRQLVQMAPDTASPWPREPFSIGLGYWLTGLAVVGWMSVWLHGWLSPAATWSAVLVTGLILAAFCGWLLPGASYLLIVPLAAAGVFSLFISSAAPGSETLHAWWLAVVVGLVWLPLDRLFYDAVGFGLGPLLVSRIALVCTAVLPLLAVTPRSARNAFAVTTTFAAVAAIGAGVVLNLNA